MHNDDNDSKPAGLREIDLEAIEPVSLTGDMTLAREIENVDESDTPRTRRFALPISLDVYARKCVVVGGDAEATDKAMRLVRAGAKVQVIATHIEPALEAAVERGELSWAARSVSAADLNGAMVVVVTPDEYDEARPIAKRARAGEFLLCVIDRPELCTFAQPAVAQVGDLKIALSSGGRAPAVLKRLRQDLQEALDTAPVRSFIEAMGALRDITAPGKRSSRLRQAVKGLKLSVQIELPSWFREGRTSPEGDEEA